MEALRHRAALAATVALVGWSCRASVQGDASAEVSANHTDAELEAEIQKERAAAAPEGGDAGAELVGEGPLLGARRDLSVAASNAQLSCSCLKLGLGQPTDSAFVWKGTPPTIDTQTQLVVGLTSEGMTCKQPKGSQGASYWGYRQSGNDVVVFVESAVKGRPMAAGAIIPKPFGDGQVFAAPAFKREPYGRGPKGEPRCKLGNPGAQRSAPQVPAESETTE